VGFFEPQAWRAWWPSWPEIGSLKSNKNVSSTKLDLLFWDQRSIHLCWSSANYPGSSSKPQDTLDEDTVHIARPI
jgi:hypothetical protein